MAKTGVHAFLDLLATAGVDTLFGNPGTTELPLSDALVDDARFRYILGLQEVPVMAMADGYAMASRRLGVVNLHISCGLGNAMGMLYNAHREGTPLLVTAGQQDRRLKFQEPILWGDMVSVARPWTKWAVEVDRVEDLPAAVRRADGRRHERGVAKRAATRCAGARFGGITSGCRESTGRGAPAGNPGWQPRAGNRRGD
jgi:benzoylformate decarboxylase